MTYEYEPTDGMYDTFEEQNIDRPGTAPVWWTAEEDMSHEQKIAQAKKLLAGSSEAAQVVFTKEENQVDITIRGVTRAEVEALQEWEPQFDTALGVFLYRVLAELPPKAPAIEPGLVYHYDSLPRSVYRVAHVNDEGDDAVVVLVRVYGNTKGAQGSFLVESMNKISGDFMAGKCVEGDPIIPFE